MVTSELSISRRAPSVCGNCVILRHLSRVDFSNMRCECFLLALVSKPNWDLDLFLVYKKYVSCFRAKESFLLQNYILKLKRNFTIDCCDCDIADHPLPLGCESRWRCLRTCYVLWYRIEQAQLSSNRSFHLHLSMTSAPAFTHPAVGLCMDVSWLWLHLNSTLVWAFTANKDINELKGSLFFTCHSTLSH